MQADKSSTAPVFGVEPNIFNQLNSVLSDRYDIVNISIWDKGTLIGGWRITILPKRRSVFNKLY
jgi:hypothetical protein